MLPSRLEDYQAPYIVGNKKYRRASSVEKLVASQGGEPKGVANGHYIVGWHDGALTTKYLLALTEKGTIIRELDLDLEGEDW